jgi:hypothetical protein
MTDDRMSGLALILGSGGTIITMSLHPTGHVAAAQVEPMIHMLIAVHALALACVPVMFLGAWGLSRRVASPDRLAVAGLVIYTFALLAVMNAAVADGLVTPSLLRQIVASAGSPLAIDGWKMMSRYNFYVNQAYAQVFVTASSIAIVLWSASIWRSRKLARGLGIYGCILGPVTLLALFSGHLNLDAHGFGIVIFGQAVWFLIVGAWLCRVANTLAPSIHPEPTSQETCISRSE